MGIQCNNIPLLVEQNNYTTKTVSAYIVYDLDNRPKIPLSNFTLKNYLFCATNIGKNNDKSKYMNSGYGIVFDGLDSWSFGNDFARNVVIFGADNISSSHTDNRKNNFLASVEGPTDDINGSIAAAEKKFSINFSKANTKFCLTLHCNGYNSYFFVNEKEVYKFKEDNKNVNFPAQYCLGSISNKLN